jgi:hypothetical protein
VLASGCGRGGNDAKPTEAASAVAGSPTARSSEDLVPDLTGLGLKVAQSSKAPGSAATQDAWIAIYENAGTAKVNSVRTEMSVHAKADAATSVFTTIAEALRHPPPDLFGPNTTQLDGTPVFQADQSRSYKTNQPDASGFRAFTDAYRMGRAIVIVYVIGRDGPETESVRKSVAEAINQRAPR